MNKEPQNPIQISVDGYDVMIGPISRLRDFIENLEYSSLFVLVDENTKLHCLPLLKQNGIKATTIEIPSGEENKNLETCKIIWNKLLDNSADRHSILLNLGGGVIGDMGGFCASTFMRGIRFIQIPTSLLAQVDASVGSKLGIDYNHLKNVIGLFNQPIAVFVDTEFLKTLDLRQLKSGYAENIKHALISKPGFWQKIRSFHPSLDTKQWPEIVEESISIKKEVVVDDPSEKGLRKILNFGHTIGHAVESYYLQKNKSLFHGEAIAIGMLCESYLSLIKNGLDKSAIEEISNYLKSIYNFEKIEESSFQPLLNLMKKDKKNKAGAKLFSLLKSIGNCDYNIECNDQEIIDSFEFYNRLIDK